MKSTLLLAMFLLTAVAACTYNSVKQNPQIAAASAKEFAQVALVEQNVDKAFSMLDPDLQAYSTKEQFSHVLITMNTPTAPKVIMATEFEPIAGHEGMNIYLTGENGAEKFYYRIPMKGNEEKGYKPEGIFRNPGPYPKSDLRQPL